MTALLFTALLSLPTAGVLVLAGLLFAEVVVPRRRGVEGLGAPGPIAIVIPAHDEEAGIAATLEDLQPQARPQDRIVVVADNCSDRTAELAEQAGADVLVRENRELRGKGYALQHALDHLKSEPPSTVLFTDADCLHSAGLVQRVAAAAEASGAPAQALYLMGANPDAPPARKVSAFAWLLMNKVRAEGLWALAKTVKLTGAGAAFPWAIAEKLQLGSGEIVEDLGLTLTLAEKGTRVGFVPDALVSSTFPDAEAAATVQRARWEHGSMRMAQATVPGLFAKGFSKPWLFLLGIDVALPPLVLFAVSIVAAGAYSLLPLFFGVTVPFALAFCAGLLFSVAVVIAWWRDGRKVLTPAEISGLPSFLMSKLSVYGKKGRDSTKTWTRTPRDQGDA